MSALHRNEALTNRRLLAALQDSNHLVVTRALELSPAYKPDPSIDEAILRQISVPGSDPGTTDTISETLCELAVWALGERFEEQGESCPKHVLEVLCAAATGHNDSLVREAAVAALGSIGAPSTVDSVLACCTDKATVRRRAVSALAAFEGDKVDAALEAAKSDRDWQVRQSAEDIS